MLKKLYLPKKFIISDVSSLLTVEVMNKWLYGHCHTGLQRTITSQFILTRCDTILKYEGLLFITLNSKHFFPSEKRLFAPWEDGYQIEKVEYIFIYTDSWYTCFCLQDCFMNLKKLSSNVTWKDPPDVGNVSSRNRCRQIRNVHIKTRFSFKQYFCCTLKCAFWFKQKLFCTQRVFLFKRNMINFYYIFWCYWDTTR